MSRWTEHSEITQDFDGLKGLLVKEQFLAVVSRELSIFLRERAPKDLQELTKLAETYMEAHEEKTASISAAHWRGTWNNREEISETGV